jgi:ferric-dicitrate binding protein FerR (iron transport regulator)
MIKVLKKYASNSCSEEEKNLIYENLSEKAPSGQFLQALKRYWYSLEKEDRDYGNIDFDSVLDKIHHTINLRDSTEQKSDISFGGRFYIQMRTVAVIFFVLIFTGAFWFIEKNGTFRKEVFYTVTSVRGQSSSVDLPDGTKVWLNGNSSLQYSSEYGRKNRTVKLTGEGYFKVHKDKVHPFKVKTQTVEVTALGTSFNVDAYDDNDRILVTLEEGQVSTVMGNKKVILNPGMQAIVRKGQLDVRPVDTEFYTSWHIGVFIFRNEKLKTITDQMEKMYDVEFVYKSDTLKQFRYRGTIHLDHSILKALEMLSLSTDISYEVRGNRVFLMEN